MEGHCNLTASLIECIPNFSEGKDSSCIRALEHAISSVPGSIVLHRTSDPDHNRTVITFAGPPMAVIESAVSSAAKAAELIDLRRHRGVHPRLGALDVLPFVPLGEATLDECVAIAHEVGRRIWEELNIPVYFYEAAASRSDRRKLEDVRRGGFEGLSDKVLEDETKRPDLGGPRLHPSAGAVIVGARRFLIAYNINLKSTDLVLAKSIAKQIRASSGGFPAVKALGVALPSRNLVQISMNITDFEQTPLHLVYLKVAELAAAQGVEIAESELIGLIPQRALETAAAGFLKLSDFDSHKVIENRVANLISRR